MADPKPPKCVDCGTTERVHPWGRWNPPNDASASGYWSHTRRCGACQYKVEHPDAIPKAPTPRKPKVPQRETLDDAMVE